MEIRKQRLSIFDTRLEDDGSKVCKATWRGQVPKASKRRTLNKGSIQDFEPSEYLAAAAEEDAQDLVTHSSAIRDPQEDEYRHEVCVPRAKRLGKDLLLL